MSLVRGGSPASPSKHLTVVDVYDLAASIGNDFERIIEQFGSEVVRSLMPKVPLPHNAISGTHRDSRLYGRMSMDAFR